LADVIYRVAAMLALAGVCLSMLRLIKGPTLADRAVALDVMTLISTALIAWVGAWAGRVIYVDVALVYGLISFLGVVAVARYREGGL